MKPYYLFPLIFLTACSTTPKLTLRPQQPPPVMDNSTVRYPEVMRAYYVGRYVDPNDDLVMHEQHVVYRVEENTRWNLHPEPADGSALSLPPVHDAAFSPVPVNDAVLAEVNDQRLATVQIMLEARTLSAALARFRTAFQQTKTNLQETAALRIAVIEMKQRLDALQTERAQPPTSANVLTNEPPDDLGP